VIICDPSSTAKKEQKRASSIIIPDKHQHVKGEQALISIICTQTHESCKWSSKAVCFPSAHMPVNAVIKRTIQSPRNHKPIDRQAVPAKVCNQNIYMFKEEPEHCNIGWVTKRFDVCVVSGEPNQRDCYRGNPSIVRLGIGRRCWSSRGH
jgi:hypothetical protein